MKRLTIDLPDDEHNEFKSRTSGKGLKMVDLIRKWIRDFLHKERQGTNGS